MQVKLLTSTQDALRTAFGAIRTCYSPNSIEKVREEDYPAYVENNNDHIRLIKQIVSHGHTSTLEHISFTFGIEDVSRSLLAQLTRHRVGFSYSVQSQRYVNASRHGFGYITPPSIQALEKIKGVNPNQLRSDIYHETMEQLQYVYDTLIASGIKPEDARYVLPNAATTTITLSVN
jgi:thymidylate synthase (FAD)